MDDVGLDDCADCVLELLVADLTQPLWVVQRNEFIELEVRQVETEGGQRLPEFFMGHGTRAVFIKLCPQAPPHATNHTCAPSTRVSAIVPA